jgi:opacity protein-like surface antigen
MESHMKKFTSILLFAVIFQLSAQEFSAGKMIAGANVGMSAFGFGFGGNFEFGFSNTLGVQGNFNYNSYDAGTVKWTITPIDIWLTYHTTPFANIGDESYYFGGPSLVLFSAENSSGKSEAESGIAFGAGYGTKFNLNENMNLYAELRYRLASFKTPSYQLVMSWYSIYGGIQFSL